MLEKQFLVKWYKEKLNDLEKEIHHRQDLLHILHDLTQWFLRNGQELMVDMNERFFSTENNFYNSLNNSELRMRFLQDFPLITRMYQGQKDQSLVN